MLLRRIDDQAIWIAAVPASSSARIDLQADALPKAVELWTFREVRHLAPTADVVPASLALRAPDVPGSDTLWAQRVATFLRDHRLADAFGELADIWLGGSSHDRNEISRLVLAHLAAHPLERSNLLGALVATFCNA